MTRNETFPLRPGWMLLAAILSTYLLMLMGTFVTSTGSGLACPDWPLCYGSVKPPLEMSIWFEWGHRLLGGFTGFIIMLSTFFVWKNHRGLPRLLTLGVLGLLSIGVILGGITVLSEAPLLDSFPRIALVSSHLVIATLVLTGLTFTLRYVVRKKAGEAKGRYKTLFIMVYLQVILGILVRYSGATLACPDFPFCGDSAIQDSTGQGALLHLSHRVWAVFVFMTALFLFINALRERREIKGFAVSLGLVILQGAFGALIVVSGMFLPFIIAHGAVGFLLLGYLAYQSMPYFFAVERRPYAEELHAR